MTRETCSPVWWPSFFLLVLPGAGGPGPPAPLDPLLFIHEFKKFYSDVQFGRKRTARFTFAKKKKKKKHEQVKPSVC